MHTESLARNDAAIHPGLWVTVLLGAAAASIVGLGFISPWMLALLAAAAIFILAFMANETLLLALVFFLPLDYTLGGDVPIRDIAVAVRLLVVIGYFLGRFSSGQLDFRKLWRPAITKAACLFIACLFISLLFGTPGETRVELRGIFFIGSYVAFYILMLDWLTLPERRRKMLLALFWSTLFVGLFALVQRFVGNYTPIWHFLYGGHEEALMGIEETGRIASFLGHPNHLATYVNLIIPFGLACWLMGDEARWKWLGGSTVAIGFIALILAQSRGGYLAFAVMITYTIWHFAKTRRQIVLLCLASAFFGIVGYRLLQGWDPRHFSDYSSDMSVLGRLYLWGAAWSYFLSSPIHGVGIGTLTDLFDQFVVNIPGADPNVQLEAHNIYFELLAEAGILGLGTFLGVVWTGYREARRQLHSSDWFQHAFAFGVAAGIVGMLVGECFDHCILWAPQVGFLFWLGVGSLAASTPKSLNAGEWTARN